MMPELPEVETVVRGLRPFLQDQTITAVNLQRKDLRLPFPANFVNLLTGQKIADVERRAKYILISLNNGYTLLVHLGMSGRFSVQTAAESTNLSAFYYHTAEKSEKPRHDIQGPEVISQGEHNQGEHNQGKRDQGKHDHVIFHLKNDTRLIYTDPRRFGLMDIVKSGSLAQHKLLKNIGPEPLGNSFSAQYLAEILGGKKLSLKAALLDQRIIAGLGNIYVNEALHRAKLSPELSASSLALPHYAQARMALVGHIRDVLEEAIRAGGSTLKNFTGTDGHKGAFQQQFAVYGRQGLPCQTPDCQGEIIRIRQQGRSTYYCNHCQGGEKHDAV